MGPNTTPCVSTMNRCSFETIHSVSFVSRRVVDGAPRRRVRGNEKRLFRRKKKCFFSLVSSRLSFFSSRAERGVRDSSRFEAPCGVPKCLQGRDEIDVPLVFTRDNGRVFYRPSFRIHTRAERSTSQAFARCSPFAAPPRARSPPAARSVPSGSRSGRSPRSARTTHPSRTTNRPFRWMPREVCWSTPWCTPTEP